MRTPLKNSHRDIASLIVLERLDDFFNFLAIAWAEEQTVNSPLW